MRILGLAIVAFGLAVSLPSEASAENLGQIVKVLRDNAPTHDANGKRTGTVSAKDVMANNTVVDKPSNGLLGVKINGSTVYLRRADVKYNGGSICFKSVEGHRGSSFMAGSQPPGMRQGAGSGKGCK